MKLKIFRVKEFSLLLTLSIFFSLFLLNIDRSIASSVYETPLSAEDTKPLNIGDKVPPVTLRLPDNKEFNLADLYKQLPVIAVFFRGGW